jgi:toxin YoeB
VNVTFTDDAWEDYLHWQSSDPKMLARINRLIEECRRTPFKGAGKPEPLRNKLSGYWSRRISEEHRLVYKVAEARLLIAQCRYHY